MTESVRILELCFQCMVLSSRYYDPLKKNISWKSVMSPVTTWPTGLYMNGKLAHVHAIKKFVDHCLLFCPFSFDHFIVYLPSI